MKDVDSAAAASRDLDDVFKWIEQSSKHAQVWKDFCSASRDGDTDKPVVVNAALKYTFLQVCETMLADALEQETEPEPEHVEVKGLGCVGQKWKVRECSEFKYVVVREGLSLQSRIVNHISPGEYLIQRGAAVCLCEDTVMGLVRLPIEPRGWVTQSSEARPGGTIFVEEVHESACVAAETLELWPCRLCTFLNESTAQQCAMCGQERSSA